MSEHGPHTHPRGAEPGPEAREMIDAMSDEQLRQSYNAETMRSRKKLSWSQPICEWCWIERHAQWDENDAELMIGLRLPVQMIEPNLEQCAYCGHATFIGVFVRDNPKNVQYPRTEDE